MEHADALERIEIAAAEPAGLERLMAGDTPDAAAVAGHLAGCPACVAELARIRRTAEIAREAIRSVPDPALRERTLAFVRSVGRDRSPAALALAGAQAAGDPVAARVGGSAPVRGLRRPRLAWTAGIAAALVIAGTLGFAAGGASRDDRVATQAAQIGGLERVATAALRVEGRPDARRVQLAATTGGGGAWGTLVFSPSSGELVVVAEGLPRELAGQEYGCWVEVDGVRVRLGRMYWGGELASWAGTAAGLEDLPPGTTFGVSVGPIGGGASSQPVLTGQL